MAAQIIVEVRMNDEDKWTPDSGFGNFDTCYAHILNLLRQEGRVVRLVIPGGFVLSQDQRDALERLGVRHNV